MLRELVAYGELARRAWSYRAGWCDQWSDKAAGDLFMKRAEIIEGQVDNMNGMIDAVMTESITSDTVDSMLEQLQVWQAQAERDGNPIVNLLREMETDTRHQATRLDPQ